MKFPPAYTALLHTGSVLLCTFILCAIGWYNGAPLTFNHDTAVYIESAVQGAVKPDRPILYGLFATGVSFRYSLWLVVLVQAFIVALTVFYAFRYLGASRRFVGYYTGFIVLVTACMSAGFEVAWVMPDVFTAVAILGVALLVFGKDIPWPHLVVISLFTVLAILVHNTHFFICLCLCCLLLAGLVFKRSRHWYVQAAVRWQRVMLVLILTLTGNLISCSIHYSYGGGFRSSFGGPVFLMSNLVEMGVVDEYLAENCDLHAWKLCAYKDSIPNNFLWATNSPLGKTGGWEANADEYLAMEKDMLTDPGYAGRITYKSVVYTAKQFFNYDLVHAYKPSPYVKKTVRRYFNRDYKAFVASKQHAATLNFSLINYMQHALVLLSLAGYVYLLLCTRMNKRWALLLLTMLLGIIANAWFCSLCSGVYPRYQTRVTWLLPLPLVLYALYWFTQQKSTTHDKVAA